jgi:hypothetical protein
VAAALVVLASQAGDLLADLQRAIARDDRTAVAALVRYPMTVTAGEVRIPVADAAALARSYEAVFTPELQAAIRDGSAIRDGLIDVAGGRITAITLPPRAAAAGPPRRVPLQQTAQLSGTLARGGRDAFVVYLEKGRLLEARIDGVPGRSAVLQVFDPETGKPLDARAAAGARVWTGRVPRTGDYRIEVARTAAPAAEQLPYVLVIRRR